MKLVRLILIALLSLSVPTLGLAGVVASVPCCAMQDGQQHIAAADGQDHCAGMYGAHPAGGCDSQSDHPCKADGKCGGCGHLPAAASQTSLSFPPTAVVATVSAADTLISTHSPDGLWHPPRNI